MWFTCWVLQWQQPVRNSSHSRPSPPQRPESPEPEPEPQVSTVSARSNFQMEENIFNSNLIGFHSAGETVSYNFDGVKDTTLNFSSFNSSVAGSKMLLNVGTYDWREQYSVCRCLLAELSQIKFLLKFLGKENTIFMFLVLSGYKINVIKSEVWLAVMCWQADRTLVMCRLRLCSCRLPFAAPRPVSPSVGLSGPCQENVPWFNRTDVWLSSGDTVTHMEGL